MPISLIFKSLCSSVFDYNQLVSTAICCLLILFICLKQLKQNESKSASLANKLQENNMILIPSPPPMPIIGHIHLLRDYQHNPWEGFNAIRKQFGDIVGLKMGIHPMILVSSGDSMREILLKKGDIFSDRPLFPRHHIIFGGDKENSLALCNWSNIHRDRRKLCKRGIVPNKFSSRNELLEDIINTHVRHLIQDECLQPTPDLKFKQTISDSTDRQPTTLNKERILFLTSDIFMDFLCGEKYSHSDSSYRQFIHGCDFVFWDINQSYLIDFLPFLTSFGAGFFYLRHLKKVTDFLRDFIEDEIFEPRYQKHLKQWVETEIQKDADQEPETNDYLDSMVKEFLSKETSMSLADYRVGFADLLAGHAAVSNILIRLLGHLSLDTKIQDMICDEANREDVFNKTFKPSLPITEASLQEALRLASSPIVPHVAREDTSIGQYYVPQGSMVLFNNYYLNLSTTLWTNPLEFDPTRFLETLHEGPQSYKLNIPKHFMPFSAGLRQCLGYKMVESTCIVAIAHICSKFVIKPNDEDLVRQLLTPKGSVALNPDTECFNLKLYPR